MGFSLRGLIQAGVRGASGFLAGGPVGGIIGGLQGISEARGTTSPALYSSPGAAGLPFGVELDPTGKVRLMPVEKEAPGTPPTAYDPITSPEYDVMHDYTGNGRACPSNVVVAPTETMRLKAPPGYVIVECPKGSGTKVAMRKETARKYGYWKSPRRPPITATDWGHLMKAESTAKKIDRAVAASNKVRGKAKWTKARPNHNNGKAPTRRK